MQTKIAARGGGKKAKKSLKRSFEMIPFLSKSFAPGHGFVWEAAPGLFRGKVLLFLFDFGFWLCFPKAGGGGSMVVTALGVGLQPGFFIFQGI